jgi:hypothetical protein
LILPLSKKLSIGNSCAVIWSGAGLGDFPCNLTKKKASCSLSACCCCLTVNSSLFLLDRTWPQPPIDARAQNCRYNVCRSAYHMSVECNIPLVHGWMDGRTKKIQDFSFSSIVWITDKESDTYILPSFGNIRCFSFMK